MILLILIIIFIHLKCIYMSINLKLLYSAWFKKLYLILLYQKNKIKYSWIQWKNIIKYVLKGIIFSLYIYLNKIIKH